MREQPADLAARARAIALDHISRMKNVQMITYPARGFPRIRLMGYFNQGWVIETLTRAGSLKTRELARDPRATFVWSWSHLEHEPMRWLIQLDTIAELVEGEEKLRLLARRISKSGPRMQELLDRTGPDAHATYRYLPQRLRIQGVLGGEEWFRFTDF
ncbi:MAG: pyridoxamine 5'-phosphate oxidase family protein [Chloroflexota bacterium]|nr:pyridoxamine 5'-phosphate oxidase family protein [Dehalococcoidia bacterium]MDW8252286.1 pyridoxamine 5'-phosphate oxidase family protein [Chloroflexota bacterium]